MAPRNKRSRGPAGGTRWGGGKLPRGVEPAGAGFRGWVMSDGRRLKSKVYPTPEHASAWREAMVRELAALPDDPVTLGRVFELLVADPEVGEATKDYYRSHWVTLAAHFGQDALLVEVDAAAVRGFKRAQLAAGFKSATVAHRMALLRRIFNVAAQERLYAGTNPVREVKLPRVAERSLDVFSPDEIHWVIETMAASGLPNARRDAAVVATLVETGLRISELGRLCVRDVDLGTLALTVRRGKTGDARRRSFTDGVKSLLEPLLTGRAEHEPAFGLTTAALKDVFRRWRPRLEAAGLRDSRRFHAHALRHTFATRYMAVCGNPAELQAAGGWKHLRTAQRYVHESGERDREHVTALQLVPPLPPPGGVRPQDGEPESREAAAS